MRLLYLYSEEWTGRRAREVHTLSTCAALAMSGVEVTLVTAGGEEELAAHLHDVAGVGEVPELELVTLSRTLGPIRSTSIFSRNFLHWLREQPAFDLGYIIHLKAGPILTHARIPYVYEAHEVFTQTPQRQASKRAQPLHKLEQHVLAAAALRIATSAPLAAALCAWFGLPNDFVVVPNAGSPPLDESVASPEGPFVYIGSIMDWKGLDVAIHAARQAGIPLKIVGGTEEEWRALGEGVETGGVEWQPRVLLDELPAVLEGARAGLIPTNPDSPSGEYSCPMKLFDYARCGLPVISTALPSLQSLNVGSWCTQVMTPDRAAWTETMKAFSATAEQADAARQWAAEHTWTQRAEQLKRAFGI